MALDLFLLYLANYSYLTIAIIMLLASVGLPFPDDLVIISVGYLAYLRLINPFLAGIEIVFLGLLLDNIYFFIGRYKGKSFLERLSKKYDIIKTMASHNERYVSKPSKVFIARFIPVLRTVVPFVAGTSELKWKTFFAYNFLALIIMTPILILLSFHFSRSLSILFNLNERAIGLVLLGLFLLGVIITLIKILIRIFKKKEPALDASQKD